MKTKRTSTRILAKQMRFLVKDTHFFLFLDWSDTEYWEQRRVLGANCIDYSIANKCDSHT